MAKPLKDLMAKADLFLGKEAVASAVSDEVSSLADTLKFATQIEEGLFKESSDSSSAEFEKIAKVMNKIAAEVELETIEKTDMFIASALENGYTKEQAEEALSKLAAEKIKKNLSKLVATGSLAPSNEDLNNMKTEKSRNVGEEKRRFPATKSLGGAR